MSATAWVGGSLLLALIAGACWFAGREVRRWALPAWDGAVAWLVDLVLALAIVIGVSQALGAVGLFRPIVLVIGVVAAAVALVALTRARTPPVDTQIAVTVLDQADADPAGDRVTKYVAVCAVAVVVGQWASYTAGSLRTGIYAADSLWYHLPRAAHFAETGWVTRLHHTAPEFPDAFHPSNAELVHALPMLAYQRDAVSPLLNLGWMALVLLAAWCVGRPSGRAGAALVGACALLASPLLVVEGAGTAGNDITAMFFLVAAVAIVLQPGGTPAQVAIAGVAAGLAVSTKLTVVPAVAVLSVGLLVAASHGERWRRLVVFAVPLVGFGAYWYVRNLLTVGSPVPSTNLPLFGERSFRIADEFGFSVADYLTDREVWRSWFFPGLRADFGWGWPLLAGAFTAATLGALLQRGDRLVQVLGVMLPVSAVAYVMLPTTALGQPGEPVLFAANVIYVVPALVVALALLPALAVARSQLAGRGLVAGYALLLVVSATTSSISTIADGRLAVAVAAGAVTVAACLAALHLPMGRRAATALVAVPLVIGATVGFAVTDRYLEGRYSDSPLYRWAVPVRGATIAVAGFAGEFPYRGPQLDNTVEYIGDVRPNGEFHDVMGCDEWRQALREGGFDHVVLRAERTDVTDTHLVWTRTDPAATLELEAAGGHIFRFDPTVPDPGCP